MLVEVFIVEPESLEHNAADSEEDDGEEGKTDPNHCWLRIIDLVGVVVIRQRIVIDDASKCVKVAVGEDEGGREDAYDRMHHVLAAS